MYAFAEIEPIIFDGLHIQFSNFTITMCRVWIPRNKTIVVYLIDYISQQNPIYCTMIGI